MSEVDLVRQTIIQFCAGFIEDPYLCYTEHGQHALFYTMLYNALPEERRYTTFRGKRMCVIQKEYPTASNLGKSRRQHWDVSVIETPPVSVAAGPQAYDYLRLAAAVEFGMNASEEHLADDVERLSHPEANVGQGFAVHLYRLSEPGALFSKRDRSPNSARILTPEEVGELSKGTSVEILYGMFDGTRTRRHRQGAWLVMRGEVSLLG